MDDESEVEDGVEKLTYADSWDAINSYLSRTAVWELCSPVRRGGEAVEPVIGKRWRASSRLQRRKWRWKQIHDEERRSHDHRQSPTLCDFSASYGDDWRAFCVNMSKSNVCISVSVHKFSPYPFCYTTNLHTQQHSNRTISGLQNST